MTLHHVTIELPMQPPLKINMLLSEFLFTIVNYSPYFFLFCLALVSLLPVKKDHC
jgi:hypothetical protein